jgi:hypothetical protein
MSRFRCHAYKEFLTRLKRLYFKITSSSSSAPLVCSSNEFPNKLYKIKCISPHHDSKGIFLGKSETTEVKKKLSEIKQLEIETHFNK